MDIEMEYVYTVYQENSFSKAAQRLFVSQSAVSAMVRKAEDKIGCQIFDRGTIPFTVTEEGRYYLEGVERIRGVERDMEAYFSDVKQLKSGRLSVGSSSFYCAYFLPRLVKAFKKRYPGVRVDIREGNGEELRQWLMEESIDILFGTVLSGETSVARVLFTYEYLVLGVPAEYGVNERLRAYQLPADSVKRNLFLQEEVAAVPLEELRDCPFITLKKGGSDLYQRGLEICRRAGFTPKLEQYLDQILTAYYVASSGAGVTFLRGSLLNMVEETGRLVYYKVGDELARRPIYLSYKMGRYVTHAMRGFLDLVAELPPSYRL